MAICCCQSPTRDDKAATPTCTVLPCVPVRRSNRETCWERWVQQGTLLERTHLHFEVRYSSSLGWVAEDPSRYLQQRRQEAGNTLREVKTGKVKGKKTFTKPPHLTFGFAVKLADGIWWYCQVAAPIWVGRTNRTCPLTFLSVFRASRIVSMSNPAITQAQFFESEPTDAL